jgi:predicted TIM-barrel fold metal-dependent hydrolase
VRDDRGTTRYLLEGRMIPPGTGRGAWVPEGMRESSVHREGAVDPALRIADMDEEGIDIAVLYGVVSLGFAMADRGSPTPSVARQRLAATGARTGRLKGTPALPLAWIDDACIEAERRPRARLRVDHDTVRVGERSADHPDNFRLRAGRGARRSHRLPCRRRAVRLGSSDSCAAARARFPFNIMFAMTTIVCGGVLERFPRLRVALLEAGAGWAPYFVDRLDEHWEHRPDEMPGITKAPSAYLAEGRLFVSTEGERGLHHVCEELGDQCVVWASDYPHWDSDFPNGVRNVLRYPDWMASEAGVLYGNAQRLYGWT